MLLLNPRSVTFGSATWGGVTSVVIDRDGSRVIADQGDEGPYTVYADVSEQTVRVRVVQELAGDDLDDPIPGEQAALSFTTAPNSGSQSATTVSMTAVVTDVKYEIGRRGTPSRSVSLIAVSSDGLTDPVVVTPPA